MTARVIFPEEFSADAEVNGAVSARNVISSRVFILSD